MKLNLIGLQSEKLSEKHGITYILVHARVNRRTGEITPSDEYTLLKYHKEIEKGKVYFDYSVEIIGTEDGCKNYLEKGI